MQQLENALIIIESPNKTKKIAEITGAKVMATIGHFKGVTKEVVKDYESYEPILDYTDDNTKYRINQIINASKGKEVYIATDPDREGYGIGFMVYELIKNLAKSIKRAEFFEITESGIEKGIKEAIPFSQSNFNDYESWKARAVSDKLVGFILSPKYMQLCNDKNNSIGRVQTPVLSLIAIQELKIQDFLNSSANKKVSYKIKAKLKSGDLEFSALGENIFESKEEAQENLNSLNATKEAFVFAKEIKEAQIKPKEPYRTSQFQEAMNRVYGFEPETSMNLAQKLFEKGLITYHRTDSNAISKEFLDELQSHLKDKEYYQRREYKAGSQSQAEAHEAIRITHYHPFDEMDKIAQENGLDSKEKAIYTAIYQNTILSQAKDCINSITNYTFTIKAMLFHIKSTKCLYKGFKDVFAEAESEEEEEDKDIQEVEFSKDEDISISKFDTQEVKKKAPSPYKESNFISLLEKNGIGRPSTYATYLPILIERGYITLEKKGKESIIIPTAKGIKLIETLQQQEEWITKAQFTKEMENVLDCIANGELQYTDFIRPLHQKMEFAPINQEAKPSEKQIGFLEKLAKEQGAEIPKEAYESQTICSDLIEKLKKAKAPIPPSEKQINLAKDLANKHNLELPKGYKDNREVCTAFIDKCFEKKSKK